MGLLEHRLIDAGLKAAQCERCGTTDWLGLPVPLELHHRNGEKYDNHLENLEILCGNCHVQTHSRGGRNAGRSQDCVDEAA